MPLSSVMVLPADLWVAVYDWSRGRALPRVDRSLDTLLRGRHVVCRPGQRDDPETVVACRRMMSRYGAGAIRSLTVRCANIWRPGVADQFQEDLIALPHLWAPMSGLEELVLDCAGTALGDAHLESLCKGLVTWWPGDSDPHAPPLRCLAVNLRRTFVQSPGLWRLGHTILHLTLLTRLQLDVHDNHRLCVQPLLEAVSILPGLTDLALNLSNTRPCIPHGGVCAPFVCPPPPHPVFTEDTIARLLRLLTGPSRTTLRSLIWHLRRVGCTHAGLARFVDALAAMPGLRRCEWDVSFNPELMANHPSFGAGWPGWWTALTDHVASRDGLTVHVYAAPCCGDVLWNVFSPIVERPHTRLTLFRQPHYPFGLFF